MRQEASSTYTEDRLEKRDQQQPVFRQQPAFPGADKGGSRVYYPLLHLARDAWSMVIRIGKETNEYATLLISAPPDGKL